VIDYIRANSPVSAAIDRRRSDTVLP
jgi:hypothetical protein